MHFILVQKITIPDNYYEINMSFQKLPVDPLIKTRASCIQDDKFLTPSLFAHLHNDSRLKGSHLQGNYVSNTALYIKKMIEFLENNPTRISSQRISSLKKNLNPLKDKLTTLNILDTRITKLAAKIISQKDSADKKTNEEKLRFELAEDILKAFNARNSTSTIFPGGWTGALDQMGHAMTYQLIRQQDKVIFLVGNTGAGISYHATKPSEKDKFYPVMAYEIPKPYDDKLLLQYISALLKPLTYPNVVDNKSDPRDIIKATYNRERVYGEIIPIIHQLGGKIVNPKLYCHVTTQGQESGTCSLRVLMALAKNDMSVDSHGDFDEVLYEMRLQSILDLYRIEKQKNNLGDPVIQQQLRPAIEKFNRYTHKLLTRKQTNLKKATNFIITPERADENLALTAEIISELDKSLAQNIASKNLAALKSTDIEDKGIQDLPNDFILEAPADKTLEPGSIQDVKLLKTRSSPHSLPIRPQNTSISDYLKSCIKVFSENHNNNYTQAVINDIEHLFHELLMMDNNFTKNLTTKQAFETYQSILTITELYAKNCLKDSELPFASRVITNYTAVDLAQKAAYRVFPDVYSLPSISRENFRSILSYSTKYINNLDPLMEKSFLKLKKNLIDDAPKTSYHQTIENFDQRFLETYSKAANLAQYLPANALEIEKDPRYLLYRMARKISADPTLMKKMTMEQQALFQLFDFGLKLEEFMLACADSSHGDYKKLVDCLTGSLSNRFERVHVEIQDYGGTPTFRFTTPIERHMWNRGKINRNPHECFKPLHNSCLELILRKNDLESNYVQMVLKKEIEQLLAQSKDQNVLRHKDLYLDLAYTQINPKCQVVATTDFFNAHSELLEEESFQTFFLLTIFEPGLLGKQLELNPDFADSLIDFIERGINFYTQGNTIEPTASFYMKLGLYLQQYLLESPLKVTLKSNIARLQKIHKSLNDHISSTETLIKLCKPGSLDENNAMAKLKGLYQVYLLGLEMQLKSKEPWTTEQAIKVIKANFFLKNIVQENFESQTSPIELQKIQSVIEKVREPLIATLNRLGKDEQEVFLWALLTESKLDKLFNKTEFNIDMHFPTCILTNKKTGEPIELDLISGTMQGSGYIVMPIPMQFRTQKFIGFFGNQEWTAKYSSINNIETCEFIKDQTLFRVVKKNNELHIQKKSTVDNEWYELINKSQYDSLKRKVRYIPEILLEKNNSLWYRINEKAASKVHYLITNANNKEIVCIEKESAVKNAFSIVKIDENRGKTDHILINVAAALKDPKHELNFLCHRLAQFEDSEYILIWKERGTLKTPLIELPRFGLKFIAEKDLQGHWQFLLVPDRKQKLVLSGVSNPIPGFNAFLCLQPIESKHKEQHKHNIEQTFIFPKGQILAPEPLPRQQLLKAGSYYQCEFDRSNIANFHKIDNYLNDQSISQTPLDKLKRNEYNHMEIQNWTLTNQGQLFQYKLDKEGHLIASNAEQTLYLVYLYLSYQQPEKAMDILREFKRKYTLSGDKKEIEMLRRIIMDIPESLNRGDGLEAEKLVTIRNPEVSMVKALACNILIEYKQLATLPLRFGKEELNKETPYNKLLEQINDNKTREFYESDFYSPLKKIMQDYHRSIDNVANDMHLSLDEEYNVLKHINQFNPESLKGALKARYRFLQMHHVQKEIQLLEKKDSSISVVAAERLKKLKFWLTKNKPYLTPKTEFGTLTKTVAPLPHPIFNEVDNMSTYMNELSRLLHHQSTIYNSIHELATKLDAQIVTPKELAEQGLFYREQDFIYSFLQIYKEVFSTIYNKNHPPSKPQDAIGYSDSDLKHLNEFLDLIIKTEMDRREIQGSGGTAPLVPQLCIMLHYILKCKTDDDLNRLPSTWFRDFRAGKMYAGTTQLVSLYPTELSFYSQHKRDIAKPLKQPPIINVVTPLKKPLGRNEPEILLAGELEHFYKEFNDNKRLEEAAELALKAQGTLVDTRTLKQNEPFLEKEARRYDREYQEGIKQNAKARYRNNVSLKLLDFQRISKIRSEVQEAESKLVSLKAIENESKSPLLSLANRKITGKEADEITRAEVQGKIRRPIAFKDLLRLYLMADRSEYQKLTKLNDSQIDELHQRIHQHLMDVTYTQQQDRINKLCVQISNTSAGPDKESLTYKLGDELAARRAYDPALHPELLVFEYCENILVRSNQAKIIEDLVTKEEKKEDKAGAIYKNKIIQMVMGGGKSKVLLPILALKKANGTNLSLIEVPSALFNTNFADLKATTQNRFGQQAYPLVFNRDTEWSSFNYQQLYDTLKGIILRRDYVITTAESLQALELKYFELLNSSIWDEPVLDPRNPPIPRKELQKSLIALEKTLKLLQYKTDAILDEVDSTLDSKKELNYTFGEPLPIPREYLETIVSMYSLFDEISIPSPKLTLEQVMLGQVLVTDKTIFDQLIKNLATVLVEKPNSPIFDICKSFNFAQKKELLNYLLGTGPVTELPKLIAEKLNLNEKNRIALLKGEMGLLPTTVSREYNVHYGLSRDPMRLAGKHIAIPYLGSNSPNEKSQFASWVETANFTVQIHRSQPASLAIIEQFLTDFKARIEQERRDAYLRGGKIPRLEDTPSGKEFRELTGIDYSKINLKDPNQKNIFENNKKLKNYYLAHYILSTIPRHRVVMRSDPQNHMGMLTTVQGVTASPTNYRSLAPTLTFDQATTFGTDGQTFDHLIRKNSPVYLGEGNDPLKMIEAIIKKHSNPKKISALIDVGALFKGISNVEIAAGLGETLKRVNPDIRHILYFDNQNRLCAYSVNGKNSLEIGSTDPEVITKLLNCELRNCFTFFDQLRTRGTDIRQPLGAIGMMTLGPDTTEVDLRQAAMRMRDLPGSQTVECILPPVVYNAYPKITKEGWNAKKVIELAISSSLKKTPEDHFRAGVQKMNELIRHKFKLLLFASDEKAELFKKFRLAFVSEIMDDPFTLFSGVEQTTNVEKYLISLARDKFEKFEGLLKGAKTKLSEIEMRKIKESLLNLANDTALICLKEIKISKQPRESEVTIQAETKQQQRKEQLANVESQETVEPGNLQDKVIHQKKWNINLIGFKVDEGKDYYDTNPEIYSLSKILHEQDPNIQFNFDNSIRVSENFAKTYKEQKSVMDQGKKQLNLFLLVQEPQPIGLRAMLITEEDADYFASKIMEQKDVLKAKNKNIWILSPNETLMAGMGKLPKEDTKYKRILEQICFYNGDCDLLQKRSDKITWLSEDMSKKIDYLEKVILPNHSAKSKHLPVLKQKLFDKLPDKIIQPQYKTEVVLKNDELQKQKLQKQPTQGQGTPQSPSKKSK